MQQHIDSPQKKISKWPIIAGLGAAFAASACCIGPFVLLMLGISGAWISNLSALEPYSPLLITVAIGFLGLGVYRLYQKPQTTCEDGSYCANPKSKRINYIIVWFAVIIGAMLLLAPRFAPYFLSSARAEAQTKTVQATLEIQKMTCNMCAITVKKSLTQVKGVKDAKVTFEPPQAVVTYDPKICTLENLVEATTKAGYPSAVRVTLKIDKMTCEMCTITVQKSLMKVEGVQKATVTLNPPQAVVVFDPIKVTLKQITEVTKKAGYPSQVEGI